MDSEKMKPLFHATLTYIINIFDANTLQEWLKWNRLHLTWGNDAHMSCEEFDAWVKEWMEAKYEHVQTK